MEALIKSDEGHLINTSSVNGFWASLGDGVPHTSYSAAKFAVKGFSEALLNDFKVNAPHLNVSLVMPGHIGTDISQNTGIILGKRPDIFFIKNSPWSSFKNLVHFSKYSGQT